MSHLGHQVELKKSFLKQTTNNTQDSEHQSAVQLKISKAQMIRFENIQSLSSHT